MEFSDPLFHIHLNVDFPFTLTGILYFPKLKNTLEVLNGMDQNILVMLKPHVITNINTLTEDEFLKKFNS